MLQILKWILKSEILLLKIEIWTILFKNWFSFHSLKWDYTPKNIESVCK